jgi:hypothetical protein
MMLGTCQIQKIVLQNASEEKKVFNLYYNSDSSDGLSVLANQYNWYYNSHFKNLWVYGKCHTVTSLIANVIGRLLTVQDANRFYHFDGALLTCHRDWHFLILLYLFCF